MGLSFIKNLNVWHAFTKLSYFAVKQSAKLELKVVLHNVIN